MIKRIFNKIVTAIIRFFTALSDWIAQLFWSKPVMEAPLVTKEYVTDNALDHDDPYIEYTEKISGLDDIVVALGLHKRISSSQQYMYEMGRRDGSIGVCLNNLADIAKATAQEVFRHIYVVLKGGLATRLTDKESRQHIMEYDKQRHERDMAYNDYVQYQYRFFPRSCSWVLGFFYGIIALALILADVPLALRLIQEGFNLEGSSEANLTISYLFIGDFWDIVAHNWETFTTALGIALCTVYIKIFYDEFIATPYANKTMTVTRFIQENKFNCDVQDNETVQQDIKRENRYKKWWKTGLAALTVLAIIILALFRLETAAANGSFDLSVVSGLAFVAVTILFPIIGGICLSHAFTNLQNRVRVGRAAKKCKLSCELYLAAVKNYTVAQRDYEDLLAASQRLCDENQMVSEYCNCLIAFYQRGFHTGGMQHDKYIQGEDFYTKVLEWRNIAISRKINYHINKLN